MHLHHVARAPVQPGDDDHLVAALQALERGEIGAIEDERGGRRALIGLARGVLSVPQGRGNAADLTKIDVHASEFSWRREAWGRAVAARRQKRGGGRNGGSGSGRPWTSRLTGICTHAPTGTP